MTTLNNSVDLSEVSDQKPHPGRRMTEEEFVAWCDDRTRAEWVDGEVIMMSPANTEHADLNGWLLVVVRMFVEERDLGRVFATDFQVRFATQRRRRLPDLIFVAKGHEERIKHAHLEGSPDLTIEIVSPDSQSRDWRDKYIEYEKAKTPEFWIIDPLSQRVEAYTFTDQGYKRIEEQDDRINSSVLPGFYLRLSWLWQRPLPKLLAVLRELRVS